MSGFRSSRVPLRTTATSLLRLKVRPSMEPHGHQAATSMIAAFSSCGKVTITRKATRHETRTAIKQVSPRHQPRRAKNVARRGVFLIAGGTENRKPNLTPRAFLTPRSFSGIAAVTDMARTRHDMSLIFSWRRDAFFGERRHCIRTTAQMNHGVDSSAGCSLNSPVCLKNAAVR